MQLFYAGSLWFLFFFSEKVTFTYQPETPARGEKADFISQWEKHQKENAEMGSDVAIRFKDLKNNIGH